MKTPLRRVISSLALGCLFMMLSMGSAVEAVGDVSSGESEVPGWLTQPLSLSDALGVALDQNAAILKSRQDIEAVHGAVVQTKAVTLPRLGVLGNYSYNEATEDYVMGTNRLSFQQEQNWNAGIRLEQSIYEGGRLRSATRSARHLRERALQQHRSVINDTLLEVRVAYLDTLLAEEQILVNEQSVLLLEEELADTRRRYEAGTVPKFNVLRAEVQLANARPRLSRARNAWRIAKNNLANLLGYDLPETILEDVPLRLTGSLAREPFSIDMSAALSQAIENRPELAAIRETEALAQQRVVDARSGYKPSVQIYGGYTGRNTTFDDDLVEVVDGWTAGAQLRWNLFDGLATRGRISEAEAHVEKVSVEASDLVRRVELEVRTAYSGFVEATEVLDATEKVVEQGEEALRLATSRYEAGTGTQLDVLAAETALTEARTTQNMALRDYAVALARLERAIGAQIVTSSSDTN